MALQRIDSTEINVERVKKPHIKGVFPANIDKCPDPDKLKLSLTEINKSYGDCVARLVDGACENSHFDGRGDVMCKKRKDVCVWHDVEGKVVDQSKESTSVHISLSSDYPL